MFHGYPILCGQLRYLRRSGFFLCRPHEREHEPYTVAHFELVATFLEVFVSNFFQQLLIHVLCSLLLGDSFQVWA